MRADLNKIANAVHDFKRLRDEQIKPIKVEYQRYIDDEILQRLPWQVGDIVKLRAGCSDSFIYYIYKGVKEEYMVLERCQKNGAKLNNLYDRRCHWSSCNDFVLHMEVE